MLLAFRSFQARSSAVLLECHLCVALMAAFVVLAQDYMIVVLLYGHIVKC